MEATIFPSSLSTKPPTFLLLNKKPFFTTPIFLHLTTTRPFHYLPLRAINTDSSSSSSSKSSNDASESQTPQETGEIRFRRGSRKRAKQQQEQTSSSSSLSAAPKEWESMSLGEKAVELYVGEKGLLFWLNKFAYASIFIVIGAWILFRFVGPSLGLYQLDSPPLSTSPSPSPSPSTILK